MELLSKQSPALDAEPNKSRQIDLSVNDLPNLERSALLDLWAQVFNEAPPKSLSQPILRNILAFEIQTKTHGGLDRKTIQHIKRFQTQFNRQRAASISAKASIKPQTSSKLKAGSRIMREWNGVTHCVDVLEDGFLWKDQSYRSLTQIAKAITSAHWSGPRFFGLTKPKAKNAR